MRVAIVSDIHGNRQAFEAVLAAVEAADVQELWCLGDLVGYGADPDACVELAQRYSSICLAGNHDLAVTGEIPLDEFSKGAAMAAGWTRETISPGSLEYLRGLEPLWLEEGVGLYHASPRNPVWEYVVSALLANLCLDVQHHRVAFIGHSHIALSYDREEGGLASGEPRREGAELDVSERRWLINPGSVGQPRDGDPRAAWLVLDTAVERVRYHRTEYDVAGAAAAIRAARLPDSLAERLSFGQ